MKDYAFFRKEKRRGKIDRTVLNGNDAISGRDLLTAAALINGGEMTPNIVAAPLVGENGDYWYHRCYSHNDSNNNYHYFHYFMKCH